MSLVDDIKRIKYGDGHVINFYSFASKYCSHHNSDIFPIYDSYVDEILRYFRRKDKFMTFLNEDLKNYIKFKNILITFRKFYSLEKFSLKEIDILYWYTKFVAPCSDNMIK